MTHSQCIKHSVEPHFSISREQKLNKPVDEPDAGEANEKDVPGPEDEEVVLVEGVVGKEADDVLLVGAPGDRAGLHRAGHLGWEEIGHWVGQLHRSVVWNKAVIVLHIAAVVHKLAVQHQVQQAHADNDDDQVEQFAEGKSIVVHDRPQVVPSILSQQHLVDPLSRGFAILSHVVLQLPHHLVLDVLPQDPGQLGHDGEDGEDKGKPDVIVSCSLLVVMIFVKLRYTAV